MVNDKGQSPLQRLKSFFTKEEQGREEVDRLHLATCVILVETARADSEFSAAEKRHVIAVLREKFSLSHEEAQELIELADEQRGQSGDLWQYTHEVNVACSAEEKRDILAEVWRLIYLDKTLNRHEDYLVHKLAKLLNIDHPTMIDIKMQVRRELFEED